MYGILILHTTPNTGQNPLDMVLFTFLYITNKLMCLKTTNSFMLGLLDLYICKHYVCIYVSDITCLSRDVPMFKWQTTPVKRQCL